MKCTIFFLAKNKKKIKMILNDFILMDVKNMSRWRLGENLINIHMIRQEELKKILDKQENIVIY